MENIINAMYCNVIVSVRAGAVRVLLAGRRRARARAPRAPRPAARVPARAPRLPARSTRGARPRAARPRARARDDTLRLDSGDVTPAAGGGTTHGADVSAVRRRTADRGGGALPRGRVRIPRPVRCGPAAAVPAADVLLAASSCAASLCSSFLFVKVQICLQYKLLFKIITSFLIAECVNVCGRNQTSSLVTFRIPIKLFLALSPLHKRLCIQVFRDSLSVVYR